MLHCGDFREHFCGGFCRFFVRVLQNFSIHIHFLECFLEPFRGRFHHHFLERCRE